MLSKYRRKHKIVFLPLYVYFTIILYCRAYQNSRDAGKFPAKKCTNCTSFHSFVSQYIPWVPEDIFFLSTLMVRGEAALTRRKAELVFCVNAASVSIRKKYPLGPRVASIALSLTFCVKKKFNISVSRKKKPTCWVNKRIKLYIKAGGLSWNVQTLWVHGYEKESRSCRRCTSREKVVPILIRCEKALKSYTKKAVQDYYTQRGFHKTACSPPLFLKSVQFFKHPSQVSYSPGELAHRLGQLARLRSRASFTLAWSNFTKK